jgi:hypothetical protein
VLALQQFDRAGTQDLKRFYKTKIDSMSKDHGTLAKQVGASIGTPMNEVQQARYYSSWHYPAIHVLASLPGQTAGGLAVRLRLPTDRVERVIADLCEFELIERKQPGHVLGIKQWDTHIDEKSPLHLANHLNWRQHCAMAIQMENKADLHYTAIHTLSKADAKVIHARILDLIREARGIVAPSPCEDAVALCVDFYRI